MPMAHIVIDDFGGKLGQAYVETDTNAADREAVIRGLLSDQYFRPLRVEAFDVEAKWSGDVSHEIAIEIAARGYDVDAVSPNLREFCERHGVTLAEPRAGTDPHIDQYRAA